MIQRILLICLVIFSFSCESDKSSYTVNGTVEGIADGATVKLQALVNNRPSVIDSAIVKSEKFTFSGVADTAKMHFIAIDKVRGNLPFILENGEINIGVNTENLNKSMLSGTKENDLLNAYTGNLLSGSERSQALNTAFREAQKNIDSIKMEAIKVSFDSLKEAQADYELKFVENNNTSLMSVMVLERMMHSQSQSPLKVKALFDALSTELKESTTGKNINKFLNPMLATAEGAVAPNFQAPNPEGKLLGLNDVKGKVTIVDFWAAWCAPCRKENPNLVRIYKKYHDKGLEIIGVSLDGNTRQQDPKAAWIKAIKDDGLPWHQVSNLKYFQDPIAQAYSIRAIPATFILDADGKIVGKDLRGQDLEDKVAELLN